MSDGGVVLASNWREYVLSSANVANLPAVVVHTGAIKTYSLQGYLLAITYYFSVCESSARGVVSNSHALFYPKHVVWPPPSVLSRNEQSCAYYGRCIFFSFPLGVFFIVYYDSS